MHRNVRRESNSELLGNTATLFFSVSRFPLTNRHRDDDRTTSRDLCFVSAAPCRGNWRLSFTFVPGGVVIERFEINGEEECNHASLYLETSQITLDEFLSEITGRAAALEAFNLAESAERRKTYLGEHWLALTRI